MSSQKIRVGAVLLASTTLGVSTYAIPHLQLDIAGGTYVGSTSETTVAPDDTFTLYALGLTANRFNAISTSANYYLAAALSPRQAKTTPGPDFGSFKIGIDYDNSGSINGSEVWVTVNVTADMDYGVPPSEANLAHDSGDLPEHGVYGTYFKEFSFKFKDGLKTTPYDAECDGKETLTSGSGNMYFIPFLVDVSNLDDGYGIHFDLYSKIARNNGDLDVDKFAPFSHDAESRRFRDIQPISTPDRGATLALLGIGFLTLVGIRRKLH